MRDLGRVALFVLLAGRVVWHTVLRNPPLLMSRRQRVLQNAVTVVMAAALGVGLWDMAVGPRSVGSTISNPSSAP